jgi:hypothetical protein
VKLNGSKPGERNFGIPYSTGLLRPPHVKRFGVTSSLFMAFEDKVTDGEGTDGFVLAGKIVTDASLADQLGVHVKSIAASRRKLERWGYIQTEQSGKGYTVRVRKSKKWMLLQTRRGSGFAPSEHDEGATPLHQKERSHSIRGSESAPSGGSLPFNDIAVTRQGQGRKKPASRAANPLHDEIRKWCAGEWEERFGRKPPWDGRDSKALKELLEARPDLALAEIQQVWGNYMRSTKSFYDEKGWPLWAFCKDFAGLSLHPIHDRGGNHGASTARKTSGGDADPRLARFRQVGRKASDFAQRAH